MKNEPLTESFFYIMLCLYQAPNHGYGIMQDSDRLSKGRVKIGSGTMYGAISNMMKKDWIMETKSTDLTEGRKRMYQLTPYGKHVLEDELKRLEELVTNAHEIMGSNL